ncbi:hypothetical protein N9Y42_05100 [Mariniblastus sp.]|nr:hypothetical protein [Mariniblastus sp.]
MNNQLTVAQILGAIQRHRFKALLAWGLVMLCVLILYVIWPRQYSSEGRLYVKMDRNNQSVVPSTSGGQVAIQDTRETEIRSVMEIIRSHAVLDTVVDEVGADKILKSGLSNMLPSFSFITSPFADLNDGEMEQDEYERLRKRELAAKAIFENMEVYHEKQSSVLVVTVRASSPELAQEIVQGVFENTRKIHLRIHNVASSVDFFDEQFVAQEKELQKSVAELAEFRNKLGVMSVGAARDSLQNVISTLDLGLVNADVSLAESKDRVAKLKELMTTTPRKIASPREGVERLSYEDSRTELYKLKQERERMRQAYTDKNSRLQRVKQQIVALERELGGMTSDRTESVSEPNPVYQTLETSYLEARAKMAGDRARLAGLKQEKSEAGKRLTQLNDAEVQSNEKLRKISVAEQYLAIYIRPRGESKAMGALDASNISDVKVAQDPTLTLKHVNPKASLVLPMGFICGLLAALGTSLFFDRNHLSATLNESEVEEVLDLPVLVTLPRVYSSRNMVN